MATASQTSLYNRSKPIRIELQQAYGCGYLVEKISSSPGIIRDVRPCHRHHPKSVEDLRNLHHLKLDSINIGIETAHDPTLERMNKGYHASDLLEQLSKLDEAGIRYNVFYLNGLGGKGNGEASAMATADVLNQLHPCIIDMVSLTIFREFDKGIAQFPEKELKAYRNRIWHL